ncbi:MAG: hypothetical protein BV456_03940 [Thermoplasmata archaeon M8B2D]|nr:MAG: hypothetical protein BV456_03940 [Thermoplasmata archaeon M8B2D]
MQHTEEQQKILSHVKNTTGLTLIDSVAGSGKTTMLVAIAKTIPHANGLYLAYNRSIATEAGRKFPKTTSCMTTHKLAYAATVKPYKLKLGSFTYRDIEEKISYEYKVDILNTMKQFCLSKYTDLSMFAKEEGIPDLYKTIIQKYLSKMQSADIECTHEFYLKLFHILLANNEIEYNNFDFIMLDEAGDLNEVTLEIFRLLPSNRKIAVGDPLQNIYTFNHTINCFEVLRDEGTMLKMSQSFRVADYIAERIEKFCIRYLDPDMEFKGIKVVDSTINSNGYLTRTNGALIAKMIELNIQNTPYALVRKATEIFRIPLMLCNIKYQGFISDQAYKHLQVDIDDWYENDHIRSNYTSPLMYIANVHKEDQQLVQAIRLIQRYGKPSIMNAYSEAKKHENTKQKYILATAHSCKGLEFDEVTISTDLNDSISEILASIQAGKKHSELSPSEQESLNLYYVACSRSAKVLNNAIHI